MGGGAKSLTGGRAGIFADAADLVALEVRHSALALWREDGWLDGWIFCANRAIDTVWRRGRAVVRQGRHVARDAIERRYLARLQRLLSG
ncbi:MAG: hypothetical protein ACREFP_16790 [Acetobacteraceae bacterium]